MKKFLIIQTAYIGDVILSTPVIEKLHSFYPEAQIDFLVRKGNQNLLESHPYITNLLTWNKKQGKQKNLIRLIKLIRDKKYDTVINLQRFTSTGLMTIFSGSKDKIGFNKNPLSFLFTYKVQHEIGNGKHEVERNIELISHLTDNSLVLPKLYPSELDYKNVSHYKEGPYICIAPNSVWFTKQYPKNKWIELINSIDSKYQIYLIGGVEDKILCDEIVEESEHKKVQNLCAKHSLIETSALIADATMNYSNDSAPMHMASAMNAPTMAIFCSTIPKFGFGPLSDNSKSIETKEDLDCRPCGLHGYRKCPKGHFKCSNITIDQLKF
ncbi:MAG: glycosyltransferase family 9 protein [Bacteroidales bacterium]|nr:glycosyltransferase family 9 protein [Bacteroidales bacterium]